MRCLYYNSTNRRPLARERTKKSGYMGISGGWDTSSGAVSRLEGDGKDERKSPARHLIRRFAPLQGSAGAASESLIQPSAVGPMGRLGIPLGFQPWPDFAETPAGRLAERPCCSLDSFSGARPSSRGRLTDAGFLAEGRRERKGRHPLMADASVRCIWLCAAGAASGRRGFIPASAGASVFSILHFPLSIAKPLSSSVGGEGR